MNGNSNKLCSNRDSAHGCGGAEAQLGRGRCLYKSHKTVVRTYRVSSRHDTTYDHQASLRLREVHLIISVPVPQIQEQIVDVPVPQIMEETVEVSKLIPQERIHQRTLKETVNVPVPQIQEQIVEVVKALLNAVQLFSSFSPAFFSLREGGREGGGCGSLVRARAAARLDMPPFSGQCVCTGTGMSEVRKTRTACEAARYPYHLR